MRPSDEHDLDNTVTTVSAPVDNAVPGNLQIIVIGNGTSTSHPLPDQGMLTIGRSASCDIAVDDKSISRRHAILSVGERVTIEDLSSANGTRVRGRPVKFGEPISIAVGELVGLGKLNMILQKRSSPRSRKPLSAEAFGQRLEEESARDGTVFAVLQIEPEQRTATTAVEDVLGEILRESDLLAHGRSHGFWVLLPDTLPPAADAVRRIKGMLAKRGHRCRIRVVCYPHDAENPHQLLARLDSAVTEKPATRARPRTDIVVSDPQMESLYQMIEQVAGSQISVLLMGETGVGKEVFARSIHHASQRASGPFVELNCAALTETLLESELFGHEKGAFTHATSAKPGLIETADGGTLFLDEIGEMPAATQAKLLRVIEAGALRRVGGIKNRSIDVRFVAATNADLEARITAGSFRRDLFYRLNGITLVIPPLRERTSEIEPLAEAFISRAWRHDSVPPSLAAESLARMKCYGWPGNIRELKYMIERAVLLCGRGPILPEHLPEKLRAVSPATGSEPAPAMRPQPVDETQRIIEALERSKGNQTQAARLLGMSRRTLVNRLNANDQIARPRKGKKLGPSRRS